MAAEEYEDDYRSDLEDEEVVDDAAGEEREPAPEHVIEPELQQPTPRNVKARPITHVTRWILLILMIGLPGGLTLLGRNSQRNWTALRDHGKDVVARVVGKTARKTGKDRHAPRAIYGYTVDGESHSLSMDITDQEYAELRMGAEVKLAYLPEKPGVAKTREDLNRGGAYASEAIALWAVSGILALIVLFGLIYAERLRGRRLALARDGTAIAAATLDFTKVSRKSNNNQWKVAYSFERDGETLENSGTFELKVIQPIMAPGAGATVLFDPHNPKINELYLGVQQSVTVLVPDREMSGFAGG